MENVAILDSGSTIRFKDKFISFFKSKEKKERVGEFSTVKDRFEVSREYINRKVSLEEALINAGSIVFVGSPLKSAELEELLYTFVVYDSKNPENVRLPEQRKTGNWKKYIESIDNPKVKAFFVIEGEELKLAHEGISYVRGVIASYNTNDNAA